MVVVCEGCSTRFRIDDARIPAKGRLVRCSQCKATFVAMPASVSFEDTVQEVVDEISSAGGAPVPEPAADLFDVGGEDLSDRSARAGRSADDERWEFDDSPGPAAADPERIEAAEAPRSDESREAPLEEVGDPAEWDLLRDSVEPAARQAKFVDPAPPVRVARSEVGPQPVRALVDAEPVVQRSERTPVPGSIAQWSRVGLTSAAWLALAVLVGAGVRPLFANGTGTGSARMLPRSFTLAGGSADAVRARFVENAFAGSLLVIRGELSRPAADPGLGLRVYLVGASGARLGEGHWAGSVPPPDDLRGLAPEALQQQIEANARAVAPGGSFAAVFELVREATGFELALEPLPPVEPAASADEV